MADGKVITGFSAPYVAKYAYTNSAVVYSNGQRLARGVSVNIAPEVGNDNNFYADNVQAESVGGRFTGGTVTLTVDGLKIAAEQLIMGVPAPTGTGNTWTDYGDDQDIPYVGIGFVVRYMEGGTEYFTPMVLTKTRFNTFAVAAQTQGEEIDWQTTELTASIMRNDETNHVWKKVGADQTTEAAAITAIKTLFNITTTGTGG